MTKKIKYLIYILLISALIPMPTYAYIDPGSGSMLLSVIITILASLGFFIHSLINKVKFLFGGKDESVCNNAGKIVIYSEGKQYWNVFKAVLDEFEARGKDVIYLTATDDDPFYNEKYEHIEGKVVGFGNKAYIKLAFLEADICLMTTPNLEVYQLKRSKKVKHYSHLVHATRCVTLLEMFALDYYDSVLTNGKYQEKYIRQLEKQRGLKPKELEVVGLTYLDELKKKLDKLEIKKGEKFTVLLAPTWGENALLKRFGTKIIDELVKNKDWDIILRPHPQSYIVEKNMLDKIKEKYAANENLIWDTEADNIISMSKADILVTDFSGILYDWAFLFNKPFLFSNKGFNLGICDASDLDMPVWDFEAAKKMGIELTKENIKDISSLIQNAANADSQVIQEMSDVIWENKGHAAKAVVDYLIKKQEELKSC